MTKTYVCLNCGTENKWKHSTTNKYCGNDCFQKHKKKERYKLIESGEQLGTFAMRNYLMETKPGCSECGITDTYNGKPITLQCDHIDGNSDNNDLRNLRMLCPNCHSQTETWCGRNKKDTKRNNYLREYKK